MSHTYEAANPAHPCPGCGKTDKCRLSPGRENVHKFGCYRGIEEFNGKPPFKVTNDGIGECRWFAVVENDDWKTQGPRIKLPGAKADPAKIEGPRALSDDEKAFRHRVYSRLLELCPKDDSALADCAKWAVDPDSVRWGSIPSETKLKEVLKILRQEFGEGLLEVPGFRSVSDSETGLALEDGAQGLFVPALDYRGNVCRINWRNADPNAKPRWKHLSGWKNHNGRALPRFSLTTHWARNPGPGCEVIVIEGERKADRSAAKLESVGIVAVPGVGNWRASNLVGELKAIKAGKVFIAYDADSSKNASVARALIDLFAELKVQGFEAGVWTWSLEDGNGLDDLVLAGGAPKVLAGEAANAWVKGLAERHGLANTSGKETPEGPAEPAETAEPAKEMELAFEPFPLECLPDAVREFVEELSSAMCCDPGMASFVALGVLSGAVMSARRIQVKPGWLETAVLWVGIVADSGSAKSPLMSAAMAPVKEYNRELIKEGGEAIKAWVLACERHEAQAKQSPMLPPTPPPPRPALPRACFDDATIQKVVRLLSDNPRGLLCFKDELSGFFAGLCRYSKGEPESEHWLKGHRGEEITLDRVGDSKKVPEPPIVVPEAYISILGGIPPGVLSKHITEENQSSGLIPRFLLVMPPRLPKRWNEAGLSDKAREKWRKLVRGLLELDWEGEPIHVGPDAKQAYIAFFESHADLQNEASGHDASHLSKLEAMAPRLALLLSVADRMSMGRADTSPIEPVWLEAAIRITQWLVRERRRIEQKLAKAGNLKTSLADRILTLLRKAGPGGLATTEIHRKLSNRHKGPELNRGLDEVCAQGLASFEDQQTYGRPVRVWKAMGGFLKR